MQLPTHSSLLVVSVVLLALSLAAGVQASRTGNALVISSSRPAHTPWQLPSWRDLVPRRISISGGVKGGGDDKETECDDPAFRKHQLSYIKEMPFIGLFDDVRATTKFEASGMTIANGWMWVVFDNLHALGRVNEQFEFRDPRNVLIGELGEDSQFEGLTYSEVTGHFFAVEEVYDSEEHGLHPFVHEIRVNKDDKTYSTVSRCPIHFVLTHENKGFEGLHLHEHDGHRILMGLCEGNYCVGGSQGRDPGNGRIVVAEFNGKSGDECGWEVIKTVEIPSTAYFTDYSGMAFRGDKAAIITQEDSAMWIGTFDFEALEFKTDGEVFHFPRDNHCDMTYCNVEGIQWIDDVRIAIASDKAKKTQPYRCVAKEQRVSIFALPDADVE